MTAPIHHFTDSKGRQWSVAVTVGALKRCVDLAGVDLAETVESDLFDRLALDPILLCNTLAAICRPEMQRLGVYGRGFRRRLGRRRDRPGRRGARSTRLSIFSGSATAGSWRRLRRKRRKWRKWPWRPSTALSTPARSSGRCASTWRRNLGRHLAMCRHRRRRPVAVHAPRTRRDGVRSGRGPMGPHRVDHRRRRDRRQRPRRVTLVRFTPTMSGLTARRAREATRRLPPKTCLRGWFSAC